jgi:hypothetical protein
LVKSGVFVVSVIYGQFGLELVKIKVGGGMGNCEWTGKAQELDYIFLWGYVSSSLAVAPQSFSMQA